MESKTKSITIRTVDKDELDIITKKEGFAKVPELIRHWLRQYKVHEDEKEIERLLAAKSNEE